MIVHACTIGEAVVVCRPRCEAGDPPRAFLFTKHVLALTNRGGATSVDIEALARTVRECVFEAFGVTLVPEPVTVGIAW